MSIPMDPLLGTAEEIAAAVRRGDISARDMATLSLAAIEAGNSRVNAFSDVTADRAFAEADAVDALRQSGAILPPLAGVPYGAKNLYDIAGLRTLAGSKINRDDPPKTEDATLVARASEAGGLLMGGLHMVEYAYGFTGENNHYGDALNPHDLKRMTGGSSSGTAAAIAAGMIPFGFGSDTNGSIRVPAGFCGLFGLKPTFGRLSRARSFPFVSSLDHVGPLGRSARDLALVFDCLQGHDPLDPACSDRDPLITLPDIERGTEGLRIAVAGGYFRERAFPEALETMDLVTSALGVSREVEIPEAARARAAAFVITTAEGGALHLDEVRKRPQDFDPDIRDRLISGAMVPSAWYLQAQRFRSWYRRKFLEIFQDVDAILAPVSPCYAPELGATTFMLGGEEVSIRVQIGIYTQPISFIGLPVVAAPVWLKGAKLPLGVQVIAPPWREDIALRVARQMERDGLSEARIALLQ